MNITLPLLLLVPHCFERVIYLLFVSFQYVVISFIFVQVQSSTIFFACLPTWASVMLFFSAVVTWCSCHAPSVKFTLENAGNLLHNFPFQLLKVTLTQL